MASRFRNVSSHVSIDGLTARVIAVIISAYRLIAVSVTCEGYCRE
jgi:hypothetical protein